MQPVLSVERARELSEVSRAVAQTPLVSLVFEGSACADQSVASEHADLVHAAALFAETHHFAALWPSTPVTGSSAEVESLARPEIRTAVDLADAATLKGLGSPAWVAVSGESEQFKRTAQIGAYVFTNLLGRSIEAVAKDIALYRRTWKQSGHPGEGHVTLVIPTLVGEGETVLQAALQAMQCRLRRQPALLRDAVWDFPAFLDESEATGVTLDDFLGSRTSEQMDRLVRFAADRYLSTAALVGGISRSQSLVEQLKKIGVDEIGCLIDFGWPTDLAREQLPALNNLKLGFHNCDLNDACIAAAPSTNGRPAKTAESHCDDASHRDTAQKLSDLWSALLDISEINPDDNFFDLGGHSLLAARAASEIERTFAVRLPLKTLMVSSLEQLAAEIERVSSIRPAGQVGEQARRDAAPARETAKRGRLASWFKNSRNGDRFQDGSQPC
jgi:acyl carrier protein